MVKKDFVSEKRWQKVFLEDNPFAIVPGWTEETIMWADMAELEAKIEDRIISSMQTSPSCIVLNWGEWGGGKTHAAMYFTQEIILKKLARQAKTPVPTALVVSLPQALKDIIRVMYRDVLGKLGFHNLWDSLQRFHKATGKESLKILSRLTGDEDLARVMIRLAEVKEKDENYELLQAYFNLTMTKTELRKIGLVRNIESITDMRNILTGIFNIMVYEKGTNLPLYSELFLWIDQIEDILGLPTKEQHMLRSFLRGLLDNVPKNLTIFLNITLPPGHEFADIPAYLGNAIMFRIRHDLNFSQLTEENALKYVKDLLEFSRSKQEMPTGFYPFEKEALKILLSKLSLSTPRKINEECTYLIESAVAEPGWKPGSSIIDTQFVKKKLTHLYEKKT